MKKRIVSLALALMMCLSFSLTAFAGASDSEENATSTVALTDTAKENVQPRGVTCDCGGSYEISSNVSTGWEDVSAVMPCTAHNSRAHLEITKERTVTTRYTCTECRYSYTWTRTETDTHCDTYSPN